MRGDIDRTLKKVSDGIAEFECVLQKINAASTANQKEKLETDLKREIKKLQKLRDQIKCWMSNSEIKNKDPLLDSRKKVELQMEKYKEYERRSKMKAYSKEGLQRMRERDQPSQCNITEWLQDRIKELKRHIEVLEMELEGLDAKRRRAASSKLQSHNFHLNNLEKLLRRWENELIDRHSIESVKDDIDYYVDKNKDVDFVEDTGIYDGLGLDVSESYEETEENEDVGGLTNLAENMTIDVKHKKSELKKIVISEPTAQSENLAGDVPTPPELISPSSTAIPPYRPIAESSDDHKRADSPQLSSATGRSAKDSVSPPSEQEASPSQKQQENRTAHASQDQLHIFNKNEAFSNRRAPSATSPLTQLYPQNIGGHTTDARQGAARKPSSSHKSSSFVSTPPPQTPDPVLPQAPSPIQHVSSHLLPHSHFPSTHYINSPKPSTPYYFSEHDLDVALSNSYHLLPESPQPTRTPSTYVPSNPSPTPSYYPSKPPPDLLDSPAMFGKFSLDLLFYLFYYRQNTHQQYLAAKELKRQSWRYHTKYLTWFQRHEEPKCIKEDFEQGTYVYFDYEIGWCQRKKTDFTFNYAFLEGCNNP
ncbi:uncharacterized protein LOC126324547 isoform X2 [Schistocerca gregaria]|uniref:uncharacterized protein LOC126324547 isoform X2 n=1 Tax=Schistocerca gregaria TaxID=7010 RepID=UPI00211E5C88|nr:uncharacterized protein LOC126324547 isoform X2 [Schistocerca gregaria]